jgi:hypothetical protein
MKIMGVLGNMLVDINPELYGPAVVLENQKKVIYVEVLKAIYSMLKAALYCGTRHLERTLKTLDSFLIHTIHAWKTRRFKDHNRQFYFTRTI